MGASIAAEAATGRKPGRRAATFGTAFAAGAAVLLASFASFLTYHGYPLLRAEVGLVALVLAAFALLMAALYAAAQRVGRALLEGGLIFLAIDLNADLLWTAALAGIVAFLIVRRSGISLLGPIALLAAVVLVTTLLGLGERRPAIATTGDASPTGAEAGKPAILHILLDEHSGLEGIEDPALREELASFYRSRGFRIWSRAYSRHFHTVNAIPDMLNFGDPGASEPSMEHVRVGPAAWFERLDRVGYEIHIVESEFADFCADAPEASCTRYWSPSLAALDSAGAPTEGRARLIAAKFASLSAAAMNLATAWDLLATSGPLRPLDLPLLLPRDRGLSSSVAALGAFDELSRRLRRAEPGEAWFAHLLLPHYPYVAGPDCALLPANRWDRRRSPSPRAEREAAWRDQVRCTMRKLDSALEAFAASPGGANAIVIVHGDHGSRITGLDPREDTVGRYSDRDLIAGFSTLFAVRAPEIEPGFEPEPAPVPDLLRAFASSGFRTLDPPPVGAGGHQVVLDDHRWVPRRRVALPETWLRTDAR